VIYSIRNTAYSVYNSNWHHMVYFTQQVTCMGKNQHVVPHNGAWAVRGAGNGRVTSTHSTQQQAIDAGRTIAQNQGSELVIHRPNGQIRDSDSHGKDPFPPKG